MNDINRLPLHTSYSSLWQFAGQGIIALLGVLLVSACTAPVRTHIFPRKELTEKEARRENLPPQLEDISVVEPALRSDTLVKEYRPPTFERRRTGDFLAGEGASPVTGAVEFDIYREFDNALDAFDAGDFKEACATFEFLSGMFNEGDSLYYEATFMLAECRLTDMDIAPAVKSLYLLEKDRAAPATIREKALLRIGHSFCLTGDRAGAEQIFRRFKATYPSSPFLPLASCAAVN